MTEGAVTVEVNNLVAKYGDREVLSGITMDVRAGEVRVILGGSGSGKSTLLKHMIGLLYPADGTVKLLGVDHAQADEPERERVLSQVGMLFQGGALLNSLSVHDNIALPIEERAPDLPRSVVHEMVLMKLALVDLENAAELTPPELSGGMKKRAALARAMALDPKVLFCDEPSAGLDPVTAANLDELILGLRDRFGMSVVVVTHELDSIKTISDRIVMLSKGKLVADGPLEEVQASDNPVVRQFFDRVGEGDAGAGSSILARLSAAREGGASA